LELVASEIAKIPGVETREYRPGDSLRPSERLKQLYICIREGAIALHLAAGRAAQGIVEVFGPGGLLHSPIWEAQPTLEMRHAVALIPTTTLELPTEVFSRELAAHPPLAFAVAAGNARQHALSLDHVAMLALRDPLRRVPGALLLLLERLGGLSGMAPRARLDVSQQLIAAFANLSRQTTNKELRRLARAGVVGLERGVVHVRDAAALRHVASGKPPVR
jgi:CRP/FNR family transcriptional regulator, cyclic AMP receptor protein